MSLQPEDVGLGGTATLLTTLAMTLNCPIISVLVSQQI